MDTSYTLMARPPRLTQLFQHHPIFFLTMCVQERKAVLDCLEAMEALLEYGREGEGHGIWIGRFVLMPDHVHLFVGGEVGHVGIWARGLKRRILSRVPTKNWRWQQGVFDHVIRRHESWEQKWEYVRQNPVRAGFVQRPEDWPYQGQVHEF
ncbi:MAG: transposase [Candidatus Methylacidiphilales bacterium]